MQVPMILTENFVYEGQEIHRMELLFQIFIVGIKVAVVLLLVGDIKFRDIFQIHNQLKFWIFVAALYCLGVFVDKNIIPHTNFSKSEFWDICLIIVIIVAILSTIRGMKKK